MQSTNGTIDILVERRTNAAAQVKQSCMTFVVQYHTSLTGVERKRLLVLLERPGGIVLFARCLRDIIVRLPNTKLQAPIWNLIDAIGFWENSLAGRWPYAQYRDWTRMLIWSVEGIATWFSPPSGGLSVSMVGA